jgi:endogenous inhibitor of DNA gyrase (YacG/DUF329 family)
MAMVMIKCPRSGKAVPTGMDLDPDAFDSSEFGDLALECPECPEIHPWSKEDAFLED